ncbi:MAG TPA: hypothetical protein VNO70_08990 [Blastocatellia bacterium]|nr:hypothetical protein [Blastocatellia bacterium]
MTYLLRDIRLSLVAPVELRLFDEYGAIFVTTATPPPTALFKNAGEVEAFQASLQVRSSTFGEHTIELQAEAMEALLAAAAEIGHQGGSVTARAADAGRRSYEETLSLWARNVTRGLEHWEQSGRLATERARAIRDLAPAEQVVAILEMEETEQLYCSTWFDKSILYSVAAPGASQHLSLLAFDVAEYQDGRVEEAFNRHGWYRTVISDLPHFTYLGHAQDALAGLGLKQVTRSYGDRAYRFWVPDLDTILERV